MGIGKVGKGGGEKWEKVIWTVKKEAMNNNRQTATKPNQPTCIPFFFFPIIHPFLTLFPSSQ
jgi:hypothetical protein